MKTQDGSTRSAKRTSGRRPKNLAITPDLAIKRIEAPVRQILLQALSRHPEDDLVHLLLHAAAEGTSITDAARTLETEMSRRTATNHLLELDLAKLEAAFNQALSIQTMKFLPPEAEIAIDLTFIPYHGHPHRDLAELKRNKAQSGTTWFHCYATAYLCHEGKRYTLAVRLVYRDEKPTDALQALVMLLKSRGTRIKSLYADKGFCGLTTIRFLRNERVPFIIPLPVRGEKGKALQHGRGSYRTRYRLGAKEDCAIVQVHVVVKRNRHKYHGRKPGNQYFPYIAHGLHIEPRRTDQLYRKRVGIETSYRLMNQARGRTSSRNPALRLLFFGLSLLIQNAWVRLRWWASPPKRGRSGRNLPRGEFTLPYLLRLVREWLASFAVLTRYQVHPSAGRRPS